MTTNTTSRPRVGRPPIAAEARRASPLRTLVTAEEADRITRLAERRGVSVSEALRLAALALLAADGR